MFDNNSKNEELIAILRSLKDDSLSGFNSNVVKAQILDKIEKQAPKVAFLAFNKYATIYKTVFATLAIALFGISGIAATSNISPLSKLYPIREAVDNAILAALPKEKQIQRKMAIANEKLVAIKCVSDNEGVKKLSASVKKDLSNLTSDIKAIKNPKKLAALSETLSKETDQLNKEASPIVKTGCTIPEDIKQSIQKASSEILAVLTENQEKVSNCPAYIQTKIMDLTNKSSMNQFDQSKYIEIVSLLANAKKHIEANDCLGALDMLQQIESFKPAFTINALGDSLNQAIENSINSTTTKPITK